MATSIPMWLSFYIKQRFPWRLYWFLKRVIDSKYCSGTQNCCKERRGVWRKKGWQTLGSFKKMWFCKICMGPLHLHCPVTYTATQLLSPKRFSSLLPLSHDTKTWFLRELSSPLYHFPPNELINTKTQPSKGNEKWGNF